MKKRYRIMRCVNRHGISREVVIDLSMPYRERTSLTHADVVDHVSTRYSQDHPSRSLNMPLPRKSIAVKCWEHLTQIIKDGAHYV